jgi:Ca2+-binding EF-hand superfamily protein
MTEAFLKKMQSGAQCEDIIAFMRRVDQDLDCKISFSEFVEALTPIRSHNRMKPSYITPTKTFQNGAAQSTIETLSGITKRKHKITNKSMISKRSKLPSIHTKTTGTFEMNREQVYSDTKHTTMAESMYKPFKETNENLIFNIMKEQVGRERQLELIKQEIAYQEVTLQNLVGLFDPEERGEITAEDLLDALKSIGFNPSKEAVTLLFNRFDRDKDGKWDYNDLGDMLVPAERDYAEMLCSRKAGTKMPEQALELIKKLITTYLHNELIDLNNKKNIKGKNSIEQIFEACDYTNRGYFTIDDVIYK